MTSIITTFTINHSNQLKTSRLNIAITKATMPSNQAAFIPDLKKPLEIREHPYPTPNVNEIVVKTKSVSLNPCDFIFQTLGPAVFPMIKYPWLMGEDVAGEVVEVGSNVKNFAVGDRVAGLAKQGFQKYPVLAECTTFKIPDGMSFEEASVVPLCLSTAATTLFHETTLGLGLPSSGTRAATGKTVLIWGGSTSVGSNAVQLATAAGYEVVSTCSPRNFDYVKSMGASHVFDYSSPTIRDDLISALKGKTLAGGVAIGAIGRAMPYEEVAGHCAAVLQASEGRKFVAVVGPVKNTALEDVEIKFCNATLVSTDTKFGLSVFQFVSEALAAGSFRPLPKAEVVGQGLEGIQGGLDILKGGVSAKKLIINFG
ncbi:putative zinc-binding alcohol dehydrogenase domain-containing protein cipB [Xylariaceae sp. FL1272]|nr:putative zinc-binding alcohol dehydrogenase domain-containing protein cipB [Xylariaceae sp. FL1272]